jgi:hypothetical protein
MDLINQAIVCSLSNDLSGITAVLDNPFVGAEEYNQIARTALARSNHNNCNFLGAVLKHSKVSLLDAGLKKDINRQFSGRPLDLFLMLQ